MEKKIACLIIFLYFAIWTVAQVGDVIVADMIMNSNGMNVVNTEETPGKWNTYKNGRQPRFNSQYLGDKNLKPGIEKFSYNFTFF